jgi:hypothetical protein
LITVKCGHCGMTHNLSEDGTKELDGRVRICSNCGASYPNSLNRLVNEIFRTSENLEGWEVYIPVPELPRKVKVEDSETSH